MLAGLPVLACFAFEPRAALVVTVVVLACFAFGRRMRKLLQIEPAGPVEDIAISAGIGFGALHCALFAIGLLHGYYPIVFAALLGSAVLFCWREIPSFSNALRQMNHAWCNVPEAARWPGTILTAFLMLFEMEAVMFALAPSLVFDMLRVHLPAVQYYAERHALRVPPYLPYAYFPQSVESVMTLGYVFAGQAAAQILPAVYFALALLALFRISRNCGIDRFGALAGLLFTVSVPAIHWTGASGKNDFALVFFILSAVLCFLRWMEGQTFRWILLGTFFLAMGAGVKHIVLFAAPPLALLYAYAAWRQPRRVLALLQLAAVFLLFGLGWQARTWIETGNPLYPAGAASAVSAGIGHPQTFWQGVVIPYLQLPWRLHFRGHFYFESVSDYPMGMVLVFFAPVWLLFKKRLTKAGGVCLLFCGLYLLYWAFAIPMIRYAIAPIAIVLMLTAGLLIEFCRTMPPVVGVSALAASAYLFLFAGCGIAINEINGPQLRIFFTGSIAGSIFEKP
ncbi:MAG: glycosyltransferase family 39 protein [Acidobacteriota bacterium]|nr:glycosyltransferase family 39 protein [Acidobacteriota bacterium]